MGSLDPQIALILLCHCATFCKLVHLALSTPPALVSEGLALFDAEVCRHFCDCSAIDTSDSEWLQVQLSLSRGGVSLCRLALHCSAAYLASVNKAGSPYKLSPYSIAWFHLQVPTLKCLYWNPVQVKKTYRPEVMTINLTSYASSPPWPAMPHLHPGQLCLISTLASYASSPPRPAMPHLHPGQRCSSTIHRIVSCFLLASHNSIKGS